ncbi:DNA primase [Corynebacterium lactis RW2-5]|uniref:DNA primase n=2 Tax=Corynebacterium lactis TaxID=1231000 RepID=A0A0K2H1F7_9CORY|nr:DNA primase [Corynebacterium lactis RW2-5]
MQAAGRIRTYCSAACRQKGYRQRSRNRYPAEMTSSPRWVMADHKRPLRVDGSPASSTNQATWTEFSKVAKKPHGFMLGGGFACIDLDHCFKDGKLQRWASRIIDAAPGAFIERSVSGDGLHIFGLLPEGKGRNYGRVEVYSAARFIRTTANVWARGELIALTNTVKTIDEMNRAGKLPSKLTPRR